MCFLLRSVRRCRPLRGDAEIPLDAGDGALPLGLIDALAGEVPDLGGGQVVVLGQLEHAVCQVVDSLDALDLVHDYSLSSRSWSRTARLRASDDFLGSPLIREASRASSCAERTTSRSRSYSLGTSLTVIWVVVTGMGPSFV